MNSLSLGLEPNTLIVGQTNGHVMFVKINADRVSTDQPKQASSSASRPPALQKIHEVKLFDFNIAKVIRTTRNDIALGTSQGVHFFKVNNDYSVEPSCSVACLMESDVTELSEFAIDKYCVASWHSNDLFIIDRQNPTAPPATLREPLWCNNLCTDLVPMPDYHPTAAPRRPSASAPAVPAPRPQTKASRPLVPPAPPARPPARVGQRHRPRVPSARHPNSS